MKSAPRVRFLGPLLVIPALLLLACLYFFTAQSDASEWVRHSVEVRLSASHLLKTLIDGETGQRGYLATGDHRFLDPFERASREWEGDLDRLRNLTRHDDGLAEEVDELDVVAHMRMAEMTRALAEYERGAPQTEVAQELLRGKHLMDDVRLRLDELDRREAELLAQRQQARLTRARLTVLLLNATFFAYLVVVARALVLRRIAQLERERAEEQAQHLRFAETFMSILGHDLRTPLNTIVMASGRLEELATGEQRKLIDRIVRSSRRMTRMIAELLDLARARLAGGLQIDCKPANLCELVSNVVDEMRSAHPTREIVFNGSPDTDGEWDADRLAQVVSNLLSNAVEHGDPTRGPEVAVTADGPDVGLRVHNWGETIPPDRCESLFEPYRGAAHGKRTGLGLGLFIAHQIVLAHGGTIAFSSSPDEGTVFVVRLPRRVPAASASAGAAQGRATWLHLGTRAST